MSSPTVLVIRATGTQGRSVCYKCLEQGFKVNAIVRDATEDRAIDLQNAGVTLFEGSIDDEATLKRALQGCTSLFLALMPRFDEEASEVRQAKAIAAAALSLPTPVQHVVLSTAFNTPETTESLANSAFKKFKEVKLRVEDEVRSAGFATWTIIRPGYFMSNFLWPLGDIMFPELGREGKLVSALEAQTKLPLIDPEDIGAFAAAAFKEPERFDKHTLTLASEEKTTIEAVGALEKAAGKKINPVWLSEDEAKEAAKTNPIIAGQLLTKSMSTLVNYDELRAWGLTLSTFERYLQREERLVRKTFDEPKGKLLDLTEVANKPS